MYFFWPRLNAQRSALSPECVNMDIHGYQDGYWGVRNAEDLNRYVSASERRETEEMEGLHILGLSSPSFNEGDFFVGHNLRSS